MSSIAERISIKNDDKFKEVKDSLERLFKSKSYIHESVFDRKVWFLKNDMEFHDIVSGKKTISGSNPLHSILSKVSIKKNDFKNLKVIVTDFIEELSLFLSTSFIYKEKADRQIKKYNAEELKNVIEEKIKLLRNYSIGDLAKEGNNSTLSISLKSLGNFPEGSYAFKLMYRENFFDCEESAKCSENMQEQNKTIIIDNNEISVSEKQNVFEVKGSNFTSIFPKIKFEGLGVDLDKSTKAFENSFSGTSFSGFYFYIFDSTNGQIFAESEVENFLDIIMVYLERFCDTSKSTFTVAWKLKAKNKTSKKLKEEEEFYLNLNLSFYIDPFSQIEILKRVNKIFNGLILNKNFEENSIKQILEVYFPEVYESVSIVFMKNEEKKDNCSCQSCLIL